MTVVTWLVLFLAFLFVEIATVGLTSIWFAVGSLVALIVAAIGFRPVVQVLSFVIVSVLLLLATRPIAKKYLNDRMQATNADSLIGQLIVVTEHVDNVANTGRGTANGMDWTVRSTSDDVTIEVGQAARVIQIQGVKLIVEPLNKD